MLPWINCARGLEILASLRQLRANPLCANSLRPNTTSTLEDAVQCFDAYTVSEGYYTDETYAAAQPNCRPTRGLGRPRLRPALRGWKLHLPRRPASYRRPFTTFSLFTDAATGAQYCVGSETTSDGASSSSPPPKRPSLRDIHLAAPHPAYDLFTPEQAGALIKSTGARSLLISGRIRTANLAPSDCVLPSSNTTVYYKTDPAHDTGAEPFFSASKTIRVWQHAKDGCPAPSCAFIQMHGKGASSCPTDTMFLSSGIGRSSASIAWYTDTVDRPLKRLKTHLTAAFPAWTMSLPSDSALVNGGCGGEGVRRGGRGRGVATGEFVHIEQAIVVEGGRGV
ncbi:hypothetical protein C8R46DRAFT_1303124 [Mycena filopes]|nr:hypothetical protein C8R46DRAFT_1303124 [Mycena filopes]